MEAVPLGKTDLKVSPIAFGTWQLGGEWGSFRADDAVAEHVADAVAAADLMLSAADRSRIDAVMARAVPAGGPSPEAMP
jgi:aryl-alcohol dehydrogenase-like predicted oxidoreductase